MAKKTLLARSPPAEVTALLSALGANLQLARVRRGLSRREAAEAIGVGERAVMDAERGRVSSSIATSVALLAHYGLTAGLAQLANPNQDVEGLRLGGGREFKRARKKGPAPRAASPVPTRQPPPPTTRVPVPVSGDDAALLGLPEAVLRKLEEPQLAVLRLLQRNGSARTSELARALSLSPSRVGGLLRTLKQVLLVQGYAGVVSDEGLPGGEAMFRFTRRGRS